jgi:ABC-type sugar transport system permease subunit
LNALDKAGFRDVKKDNTFYWYINQYNIRISWESAELWRVNDPEGSRLGKTREKEWVWMNQCFVLENAFEISNSTWFLRSVARFGMSVVAHGSVTVQNVVHMLTHRFLQNTVQGRSIFEYLSIIKCLMMQLVNSNFSHRWLTRFYDGCICVNSIQRSWPDREVLPQSK